MKYTVLAHYGKIVKNIECNDIQHVVDVLKQLQGSSMEIIYGRESSIIMLSSISLTKNNRFVVIKEELEKNGHVLSDVFGNLIDRSTKF